MKIGAKVLRELRGPLLVAALSAGCATASPGAPDPEPAATPPTRTEPMVAAAAIDPVAYDAEREAARLERLDRAMASDEARRDRRVESEREARRPRPAAVPSRPPDYLMRLCGRG